MADITLICAACGKNFKVSEYAEESVTCPQCGQPVGRNVASAEAPPRLHLASMAGRASLVSPGITPDLPPAVPFAAPVSPSRSRLETRRHYGERRLWLLYSFAWVLFFVMLGALLTWQWLALSDAYLMKLYLDSRWILAALAWLVVLLPAFGDTYLQGLLCLLIPPYAVYYALNRLDHFYLRAIFFAVALNLAAEYYFLPGETLFSILQAQIQEQLSQWAAEVRNFIDHAHPANKAY